MNDECYLKLLYRGVLGRPLHLDPPVLYSEKIQWLKLHDKNPIYPILCDKIAVRDFVKERVGEQLLTNLYDTTEGIKFGELTLHSSSGLSQTMTQRGERFLGELLRLENVK